MLTMTILITGTILAAAAVAVMSVIATEATAEAALASPFGVVGTASADTLEGGMHFCVYPPAQPGEWQLLSCDTLQEAEYTLDSLENHGVKDRELVALSNSCFAVRWKA